MKSRMKVSSPGQKHGKGSRYGDFALGAAKLEGPWARKWWSSGTSVRRVGEQAELRYRCSIDELLEEVSDAWTFPVTY